MTRTVKEPETSICWRNWSSFWRTARRRQVGQVLNLKSEDWENDALLLSIDNKAFITFVTFVLHWLFQRFNIPVGVQVFIYISCLIFIQLSCSRLSSSYFKIQGSPTSLNRQVLQVLIVLAFIGWDYKQKLSQDKNIMYYKCIAGGGKSSCHQVCVLTVHARGPEALFLTHNKQRFVNAVYISL